MALSTPPKLWYIKAAVPASQKEAISATLGAHGIALESMREVPLPKKDHLPPFLELVFPVAEEDALATAKAIAHAAQTANPKASKIFLLPDTELVHLKPLAP